MDEYFYHGKICLNVLAKDINNAKDVYDAAGGHVIIGVLSSQYDTVAAAVADVKKYKAAIQDAVSLGLGAGNPRQWKMVADIGAQVAVPHMNQVFPAVGYSRAKVSNEGTWINSLVRPTADIGYVNLATGPISEQGPEAKVSIETAIRLTRDMGGNALKFFPMGGLKSKAAYQEVARVCAAEDFALEPTGGMDLDNFKEIVAIALDAGVKKVIPHVYSSIIDAETGKTRVSEVEKLYKMIQEVGK